MVQQILPNFLVLGASKSGTTSLYHYLKQHPDIFLSDMQKEGRYFSQMSGCFNGPGDDNVEKTITKDQLSYHKLFEGYQKEKAIGDISPEYLFFHKKAIPLIKSTLGEGVRIVIILRSPVERAYSAYMHFKRDEREKLTFEDALEKEGERRNNNWLWTWQYRLSGLYFEQVKDYLQHFKNTHIILHEDFKEYPDQVLHGLCGFLGVDSEYQFDTSYKYNVSGEPKNAALYKLERSRGLVTFLKKIIPHKITSILKNKLTGEKQMIKTEMNPQTREELLEFFKEDILKLQKLIQRDLSGWLR